MMSRTSTAGRWFFTSNALRCTNLTRAMREKAHQLASWDEAEPGFSVVVAFASEIIQDSAHHLPSWAVGADVWYLVIADVPVPALVRLPAILRLHRPDQRLHLTVDPLAVRRLITAQARREPFEGIVDAYMLSDSLVTTLGDLTTRTFPIHRVPRLQGLSLEERSSFTIDEDGSFLFWPSTGIHLGTSQLLQAVDPSYLAEVEIQRHTKDRTGAAISQVREARNLRQVDIPGLSERQVRRIEQGISRLTAESASKFAAAFDLTLRDFLDDVARRVAQLRQSEEDIDIQAGGTDHYEETTTL